MGEVTISLEKYISLVRMAGRVEAAIQYIKEESFPGEQVDHRNAGGRKGMYRGIGIESGKEVSDECAFDYAKNHLDEMTDMDKQTFVEFFFSGNWIREEDHAEA